MSIIDLFLSVFVFPSRVSHIELFLSGEIVTDQRELVLQIRRQVIDEVLLDAHLVDLHSQIDDVVEVFLSADHVVRLAPLTVEFKLKSSLRLKLLLFGLILV